MKFYTLLLIIIITLYSCGQQSQKDIESSYLSSFFETVSMPKSTKWVVILPGLGCHGCIQEAEQFMKENINNKEIFFILTSVSSYKILEGKIGVKLKEHNNILNDSNNLFHITTDNAIYPCIVQLEKGEIKAHEFQSPKNSQAFANLQSRIE